MHYFGNSPRAMPGVFSRLRRPRRESYDRDHASLSRYRELIPYYEWVEHTLPVQTAAMGTKEQRFLTGAAKLGLPHQTSKDITGAAYRPQENAILQPQGTAGRTNDRKKLDIPRAKGCTFCGHCPQGCNEPVKSPRNLRAKRSTTTATCRWRSPPTVGRTGRRSRCSPDAFAVRIETDDGSATGQSPGATRARARRTTEEAKVVVLAAGPVETPRLWLNSGLPNPNDQVGRGLTDHHLDYLVGRFTSYTGSSKGPTSAARLDFPGFGGLEQAGVSPGLQGQALTSSDSGIAGFYDNGAPVGAWGANAVGRLVGERLKRFMKDVDRLIGVALITDDDVLPQNRVTLSTAMAPDAHGPIARLEVRARSPRTLKNREYLASRAVELLQRGRCPRGCARELPRSPPPPPQHDADGHERRRLRARRRRRGALGQAACSLPTTPRCRTPSEGRTPRSRHRRSQPAPRRRSSSATSAVTPGSGASHRCRRWTTR